MKFCKLDIPKFCKDIPKGEGKTIECLKKNYEVRLLCLAIRGKNCNFVARTCTYISTADISFLIFFLFKRLCAKYPRLRTVSLSSSSVDQNSRETLWRKTASRGREDTRVWYRETMFSQMVSYDFSLHGALHGYFLYLVSAPPEKPTRRCEPEEGYLRCSKRFGHRSHSIIFLLFELKSVR